MQLFTPESCAFIVDDIVAIIRLCKAVIGSFFGTTLLGYGVAHFIAICASVAAFVTGAVVLMLKVYSLLAEYLSYSIDSSIRSVDVFGFVAYVLNFDFLVLFCSVYYFVFCTITIAFISLLVADFVSHVYPYVMQFLRSSLNWIGGDS